MSFESPKDSINSLIIIITIPPALAANYCWAVAADFPVRFSHGWNFQFPFSTQMGAGGGGGGLCQRITFQWVLRRWCSGETLTHCDSTIYGCNLYRNTISIFCFILLKSIAVIDHTDMIVNKMMKEVTHVNA